jgi:hypothetical protein
MECVDLVSLMEKGNLGLPFFRSNFWTFKVDKRRISGQFRWSVELAIRSGIARLLFVGGLRGSFVSSFVSKICVRKCRRLDSKQLRLTKRLQRRVRHETIRLQSGYSHHQP